MNAKNDSGDGVRPQPAPAETCEVKIRRGDVWTSRSEPCGKRAKGILSTGEHACGIHLRVERNDRERGEKRRDFEQRKDAVNDSLGIHCFGFDMGEPLTVMVRLEDLERLAGKR